MLRKARGVLWPIAAAAVFAAAPVARANEPTPDELLQGLTRSLALFDRSTYVIGEKYYTSSATPRYPANYLYREGTYHVWRDGMKRKQISTVRVYAIRKGKRTDSLSKSEAVSWDDKALRVRPDPKTGKASSAYAILRGLAEQDRVHGGDRSIHTPLIDGMFGGNQFPLPETLRQSRLSVKKAELGGRKVWLLEGTGDWGYHAVWLDPARGLVPLRIVQRKQRQHKGSDGKQPAEWPVGPIQEYAVQLDANRVETVNGRALVTQYTLVMSEVLGPEKTKETERFVVSLSEVNLNPDFSKNPFTLSTPLTNGSPVTVEGQEMINHEWRDGEVVKSVNQDSVASLGGHTFQPGRRWGTGLTALAAVAVAGGAVYLWLRRRQPAGGAP